MKKKNYKKYLAGILACVMVASTSATAFAESNSTYTNVENASDVAGNVIITNIDKDNAGHGGRKWKLKDKSGNRVASLGENGEILGK